MPPVRRLTVLQDTSADETRPRWQWLGIGVIFAFTIWLPLSMLGVPLSSWALRRAGEEHPGVLPLDFRVLMYTAGPPVLAFGIACWASAALVGRFGSGVTVQHTRSIGLITALLGALVSTLGGGALPSILGAAVLGPIGWFCGSAGGSFGLRRRATSAVRKAPPAPSER